MLSGSRLGLCLLMPLRSVESSGFCGETKDLEPGGGTGGSCDFVSFRRSSSRLRLGNYFFRAMTETLAWRKLDYWFLSGFRLWLET